MSLNAREYFKKKAKALKDTGITERDLWKLRMKKENRQGSKYRIYNSTRNLTNYEKAMALRVILESMPGKTLEEKRKAFKDNYTNRDLANFLRKQMYVPIKSGISGKTVNEKIAAGIEKIRPVEKDALRRLIENNFNLEDDEIRKGVNLKHRVINLLSYLEAAGIIKKIKKGRGGRITKIEILNPTRLKKTLETGYVQWPELKPLFKRKQD